MTEVPTLTDRSAHTYRLKCLHLPTEVPIPVAEEVSDRGVKFQWVVNQWEMKGREM